MNPPKKKRMQFKDLNQTTLDAIQELALKELSNRKISEGLGISRGLVAKALPKRASEKPETQSKLLLFLEKIKEQVLKEFSASRIFREMKVLGYKGGRTILAKFVSQTRSQTPLQKRKQTKRRFETCAGLEMQVDWSPGTVMIGEKPVKIHVLGIVLCHCRKLFYAIYRNERSQTLLEGLATGFTYFQGVSIRCVFDNMSTVVLGRIGRDRKPNWNTRFIEFSKYYGFEPFLCAVADPNRKGKKEKAFRLVFDDFLKGSTFETWEDMQTRLSLWLDGTPDAGNLRKHGTTGLVPNEAYLSEREFLIKLPEGKFPVYVEEPRAVDGDSTLSVHSVRYTVPSVLAFRTAFVRLYANHFEVLDSNGLIQMTRKYVVPEEHPGSLVIDSTHYANLPRQPRNSDGRRQDQAFVDRFPMLEALVDGIKMKMKSFASIHLRSLLRMAVEYGEPAFIVAATKAQKNRRFDANAVKRILEQEHPVALNDLAIGKDLLGDVDEDFLDIFAPLDRQTNTNESEK